MKKLFAAGLALSLLFSLTGCMADPTVKPPSQGGVVVPGGNSPAPSSAPLPFADREMRIALCTSPASVNDRGSNAACYNGILNFMVSRNLIDAVSPLQGQASDPEGGLEFLRSLSTTYDVFLCVGPAFSRAAEFAREHPELYVIVMDAAVEGEAGNLCSISYAEEQCGFFAGVAAALETKTGHVAVVNSTPDEANTRYHYAFRSGVAYTNGNFGTTAEVMQLYDPEYEGRSEDGAYVEGNYAINTDAGYGLGKVLIASGCDVLFVAAGASGLGVYTAAAEYDGDVWIIGAESDQFFYGERDGKSNFVLTSVTKSLASETEALLNSIADGTFQSGSRRLTAADNAVNYVSEDGRQQLSEKAQAILLAIYPMMQDGTIVPGTGPQ